MTDTATYQTVAKVSDLEPGELMYVEAGDAFICLINMDGEIHALDDTCTHEEASLSDGTIIDGRSMRCGAFDIRGRADDVGRRRGREDDVRIEGVRSRSRCRRPDCSSVLPGTLRMIPASTPILA